MHVTKYSSGSLDLSSLYVRIKVFLRDSLLLHSRAVVWNS